MFNPVEFNRIVYCPVSSGCRATFMRAGGRVTIRRRGHEATLTRRVFPIPCKDPSPILPSKSRCCLM